MEHMTQLVPFMRDSNSRHVGNLDLVAGVPGGGDMELDWECMWALGGI